MNRGPFPNNRIGLLRRRVASFPSPVQPAIIRVVGNAFKKRALKTYGGITLEHRLAHKVREVEGVADQ